MRFNPSVCPECGQPAESVNETVPGQAEVSRNDDGSYEYSGSTRIVWDGQTTDIDEHGRATVWCEQGHEWPADLLGDDDEPAGGQEAATPASA